MSTNGLVVLDQSKALIVRLQAEIKQLASEEQATKAVDVIVACCVKPSDIDEIEIRIRLRQLWRLLTHYPACVVDEITDPFSGIIGKQRFLPAVEELKAFADMLLYRRANALKREQRMVEQIESRPAPMSAEERAERAARADAAMAAIRKAAAERQLATSYKRENDRDDTQDIGA